MIKSPTHELETLEGIKESVEICFELGLTNKLWDKKEDCKKVFDWLIRQFTDTSHSSLNFHADNFVIILESLLEKLYIKEVLEMLEIEREFSELKKKRGEKCYQDLAHSLLLIVVKADHIRIGRGKPPRIFYEK